MRRNFMGFSQNSSQIYDHCNPRTVEETINHDENKAFKESLNCVTNDTLEIENSEDNSEKVKIVENNDCLLTENQDFNLKSQVLQHMTSRFKGAMFINDQSHKMITDEVVENGLSFNGFHTHLVDSFDTNSDEKWTNQRMTRSNHVIQSRLTSNEDLPRHEFVTTNVTNSVLVSNGSLTCHNKQQISIGNVTNQAFIRQQYNDDSANRNQNETETSNERLPFQHNHQLTNSYRGNGLRPRHTVNQLINGRPGGHKVTGRFYGPNGEQRVIFQRIPPIARCTEM